MVAICFGSCVAGLFIGLIFSLLFVACDGGWKKALPSIFATGANGAGLWGVFELYNITDYTQVFVSIGVLGLSFVLTFVVCMLVMCLVLKDKDDKYVPKIRDILLGQKQYIQQYYDKRAKEIDEKLNIPILEKRENDVTQRELQLNAQREVFQRDKEEFAKLTADKLKITLPEHKELVITKEFLDVLPSHVDDLAAFIEGIKKETHSFLKKHNTVSYDDLKVYLTLIAIQVLSHLFAKGAKDVRVHFRCFDEKKNGYGKLVSVIGGKESKRDLTFIPYDKANMIKKSFECKRALIKSHNIEYDYVSNNSTMWTEYMTGAFYNITRGGKPCLSFGISVKNAARFKNVFNFLSYCKFETYLQDVIEQFDERYKIETILYPDS